MEPSRWREPPPTSEAVGQTATPANDITGMLIGLTLMAWLGERLQLVQIGACLVALRMIRSTGGGPYRDLRVGGPIYPYTLHL